MISILACSWLPLPPCLPSFVSLHDLPSRNRCRCHLVYLHLSPCVISILACSWLPLPPCPCMISILACRLVCLVSLLLAAAAALSMISIVGCSWLPPCLPTLSPFMISGLGCSWLPPCLFSWSHMLSSFLVLFFGNLGG